jgi:AraC-like DNA-binding protein
VERDLQYLTYEQAAQALQVDTQTIEQMVRTGELLSLPLSDEPKIPKAAIERARLSATSRALMVFDDTLPVEPVLRTIKQKIEAFRKQTGLTPTQYLKDFEAGLMDMLKDNVADYAVQAEELLAEQKEKQTRQ